MKTFTKHEILELYGQVTLGEISFSQMVEIMNERVREMVNEAEVREFKDGDFLHSDWDDEDVTIIFKNQESYRIYYHASKSNYHGLDINDEAFWNCNIDFHHATEAEKQELLDALAKEGKRWNEGKKCIEDIPKRKFKKGDKVRIKHGVSSKTHDNIDPSFVEDMDDLIGKTMTVDRYTDWDNYVKCEGTEYSFLEEWLEPYVEELKKGDLAIFWNNGVQQHASVRMYGGLFMRDYCDTGGVRWDNAIKFESKEQYEKLIKGEL